MHKIRKLLSPRTEEGTTADLKLMKTSQLISSLCQSDSHLLGLNLEVKTKEATIERLSGQLQESQEELYRTRASHRALEIQLDQAKKLLVADSSQFLSATEELVTAIEQTALSFHKLMTEPNSPETVLQAVVLTHPCNTPLNKSLITLSDTLQKAIQQTLESRNQDTEQIEKLQDQIDDLTYQHQANLESLQEELAEANSHLQEKEQIVKKQARKIAKLLQQHQTLKCSGARGSHSARQPSQEEGTQQVSQTLQLIKSKLDRAYKSLLVEISRSTDVNGSFYSMNSAAFCNIEKELNSLLMSLHESIENEVFAQQQPRNQHSSLKASVVDGLSRALLARVQRKNN